MSYYYKYNFTSSTGIFAIVKEELKSYFDTGAVDDLMFPTYVNKCLDKLGKATYVISEEILYIEDFQARLPDNFSSVREAWMCTEITGRPYQSANALYSQAASSTTIQISPVIINGRPCSNLDCQEEGCPECMPVLIQAVYKTTNEITRTFAKSYILKPGNISAKSNCDTSYMENWRDHCQSNTNSSDIDSFDIRDNKIVTNFRSGVVNLIFYAREYDGDQIQMIPDNYRVKEYIEAFIKYKVFETISNQTTDETFNQVYQKMLNYKQLSDEAFIMADVEIKKQTVWQKQRSIMRQKNSLQMYELPDHTSRYGRRNRY